MMGFCLADFFISDKYQVYLITQAIDLLMIIVLVFYVFYSDYSRYRPLFTL